MLTPTRDDFLERAKPGDLIPVYREILADRLTPVSAYERIAGEGGSFLLESVEGGERLARYSFLGSKPFLTFRSKGRIAHIGEGGVEREQAICEGGDPLDLLKELLGRYRFVETEGLPRFCGGAVGYLAYDIVRFFEDLPETTVDDLGIDDACFLFTDSLLIFDHVKHRMKVLCNARVDSDPGAAYDLAAARIDELVARLRSGAPPFDVPAPVGGDPAFRTNISQERYEDAVLRCKEYIAAGDAFQVVPSMRVEVECGVQPFELYRALRSINPSPYMYYLDVGDRQVVGSSPEILVTVEDRHVTVRPIAGTRPRGTTEEEDLLLEQELLADQKERAEHIMLVDLGRNDVGRVATYGTVRVDELMAIERYSHVMHIVSNVTGDLAPDKDVFDVTRACFPAGTLTGAPKVRAMEIIEELETTRRGLYGGAVGYYSFSGDMDFAIAIRTMLVDGDKGYIQVGAGIVADSDPASEYVECRSKAMALLAAVSMAQQGLE